MFRVVCVLLGVVGCLSLPSKNVEEDSAETLLAQIRSVEHSSSPDSTVIAQLKDTLTQDMERVRLLDDSDRATLTQQIAEARAVHTHTLTVLHEIEGHVANLTSKQLRFQKQVDNASLNLDLAKAVFDSLKARVQEQDQIESREQLQFTNSVSAIERDLQVLDQIEHKLNEAVEKAASNAGIEPNPLLHQVALLVSNMRRELAEARSNSHIEWDLTRQRLALESQPLRNQFESSRSNVSDSMALLTALQTALNDTVLELSKANALVTAQQGEVKKAEEAVSNVQTQFEQRHNARAKRLQFMSNLLSQMDVLQRTARDHPEPAATS